MLSVKYGVSLVSLQQVMAAVLFHVDSAFTKRYLDCVITSGDEGRHMKESLHYRGLALDFRISGIRPLERVEFAAAIVVVFLVIVLTLFLSGIICMLSLILI